MLTITRRFASNLKAAIGRAFGTRGPGPAVCFTAAAGTLTARARSADIAVAYAEPNDGQAEALWLPRQFLDDCAGTRDEPVHIEKTGKGHVTAQWRDGSVPQIVKYDLDPPADAGDFPELPETLVSNPPDLLRALVDAAATTDPDSLRYALGCLQLRAAGTVIRPAARSISAGRHSPAAVNV